MADPASEDVRAHYGALKVKDAIVDQLRDEFGVRPSIDTAQPDIRVNVYLLRDQATRNFGNHILWQADPDSVLLRAKALIALIEAKTAVTASLR